MLQVVDSSLVDQLKSFWEDFLASKITLHPLVEVEVRHRGSAGLQGGNVSGKVLGEGDGG